ncbi:hypothetical protein FEA40_03320 [Mannheimia haemolytica]|nr:hypothetical protein B824_16390 [Mannheimia haemolytica USDA-ARS-USMARC-184]TRC49725.1 hypothetical protein FEA40_03320 [Mannheimia haemolytica]TRC49954.1 hypothetical protein FEA32_03300 [Mannheimia haemolytica]
MLNEKIPNSPLRCSNKEFFLQIQSRSGGSEGNPAEHHFAKFFKKITACMVGSGSLLSCPNDLRFLGK